MKRRTGLASSLAVSWLVAAFVGSVLATAYSPWRWNGGIFITGYPGLTDSCQQTGILDTAKNYHVMLEKLRDYDIQDCTEPNRQLVNGYIGAYVSGYRDGAYCGTSGWLYTSTTTEQKTVVVTLCTNPAGVQVFRSVGWGRTWDGDEYWTTPSQTSPNQNY